MKIKQADNRKQKSCFSILSDTFKDFAEHTSIHGLKYIVRDDTNPLEKLFWLVVVTSGVCGAAFVTMLFWERYRSNPTRTSVLTTFAPTLLMPFPAVTVCNINRIMVDRIDAFVRELNLEGPEADLAKRTLPQLLAFTNPSSTEFNTTELQMLQTILEVREISDINFVMKKISQTCHDLLVKCVWTYKEEDCMIMFKETLTVDGYCCSFNYVERLGEKIMYTSFNGPSTGLYLILDTMSQSIQYSKHHSKGLQIKIHNPEDYPGEDTILRMATKGRQTDLQILGTQLKCSQGIKALPISHRKCVFPDEIQPVFFNEKYSNTNCLTECNINYFKDSCDCVPFYYQFSGFNVCNMTQMECLLNATKGKNSSSRCDCPPDCEENDYEILFTSTQIELTNTLETRLISESDITTDTAIVNIYFVSNTQSIFVRDTITSTIYLLSSFGGVCSLFMGCSILTIGEILYFFIIRFIINIKQSKEVYINNKKNKYNKVKKVKNNTYFQRNLYLNKYL